MAWRRAGDKPLSEPMMFSLPTHICVTRPQWVNSCDRILAPINQPYDLFVPATNDHANVRRENYLTDTDRTIFIIEGQNIEIH